MAADAQSILATQLAAERGRFLAFAAKQTRDHVAAEEALQEATALALARGDSLRDVHRWEAWFYRILRNVIVDRARRRRVEARATDALMHEPTGGEDPPGRGCGCVLVAVERLKPEYGDALRSVEVEGMELRAWADERGITPNNAAVRLHRARASLRKEVASTCGRCADDGCRDCDCQHAREGAHGACRH